MALASHLQSQGSPSKLAETPPATDTSSKQAGPVSPETAIFTDMAEGVGIDFVHFNGMSGEYYYCEPVGSGTAMFDYDNDGDLREGLRSAGAGRLDLRPCDLCDRFYRKFPQPKTGFIFAPRIIRTSTMWPG